MISKDKWKKEIIPECRNMIICGCEVPPQCRRKRAIGALIPLCEYEGCPFRFEKSKNTLEKFWNG